VPGDQHSLGDSRHGRRPPRQPRGDLRLAEVGVEALALAVDGDPVALLEDRERAAELRLGRDVADAERTLGGSAEAGVGDDGDVIEAESAEEERDAEVLAEARAAARTLVADHHHVPRADPSREDREHRLPLAGEDPRRPAESLARSPAHRVATERAVGGQIPPQHLDPAGRMDGPVGGQDDLLAAHLRGVHELAERGARHRRALEVELAPDPLEDRHHASGLVEVHQREGAARAKRAVVGRVVAQEVEAVDVDRELHPLGQREQVQEAVGAGGERHDQPYRVLDRPRRDQVGEAKPLLHQLDDPKTGLLGLAELLHVAPRRRRSAGEAEAHHLGRHLHRVRGGQLRAGAAAGHPAALHPVHLLAHLLDLDPARQVLVDQGQRDVGRERGRLAAKAARPCRAAGQEDGGEVESGGAQPVPRHDLVAGADADQTPRVVVAHLDLDAVGDRIALREVVEHHLVIGSHVPAMSGAGRDGRELDGHAAAEQHALLHGIPQPPEVDVAEPRVLRAVGDRDRGSLQLRIGVAARLPEEAVDAKRREHLRRLRQTLGIDPLELPHPLSSSSPSPR
jgi:hypothetical protein